MEHDIRSIYERFLAGQCNQEELIRLLEHFRANRDEGLHARIESILEDKEPLAMSELEAMDPVLRDNWQQIRSRMHNSTSIRRRMAILRYTRAVAAVLIVACTAILAWYLLERTQLFDQEPHQVVEAETLSPYRKGEDALPGRERAILTLGDGNTVVLDTIEQGKMLLADGLKIRKNLDGTFTYLESGGSDTSPDGTTVAIHTVRTPKGGTVGMTLPDGSLVWLNADATLKFPVNFTGGKRQVSLEGEAYFDVSKDPSRPFEIEVGRQRITVLGTSFNVSAYPGEAISTTLVSGRVRLERGSAQGVLLPGQQARWNGRAFDIQNVDVEPYIAWKKGWFIFHDVPMKEILVQLSRWYQIEIDDQTANKPAQRDRLYYGEISRDVPLSAVLAMLSADGSVHFELKGGVLYVK